jgi:GDPmannose 4,6-dehydratase
MTIAAVLGLDTAAGAYLARLLGARGVTVRGTGGAALLDRLGIAGDVVLVESATAAVLGADLVFDVRGSADAAVELLALTRHQRVFVAVDPGDAELIATLAAARTEGRFVATGRVYPNESRLGPGTSPVARIVAAAAAGNTPDPDDLASTTDCGWTPEYVDAMARLLALPTAADLTIATGVSIPGTRVARVAAAYFGRSAPPASKAALQEVVLDSSVPGWRAITVGDDLVNVLSEGAAAV